MPIDLDILLRLLELTPECPRCSGQGYLGNEQKYSLDGSKLKCYLCQGTGRIPLLDPDGKFGLRVVCSECKGTGVHMRRRPNGDTKTCEDCQGHG